MKILYKYIKQYKKTLILALVLATINQTFSLLDPQIFRLIIDNYATKVGTLPKEVFLKGIILLLLASVGVALVSRIAKNFQDYFVSSITQRVGTQMYSDSVEHTLSLPYEVFEDRRSGEVLQKLQKARADSQIFITTFINVAFLSLIGLLFVITYAFIVNWMIGLTYFLIIPILGVFTFVVSKKIKEAQKSIVVQSAELAGSTTETLRNVELVKSLGLESQEIGRLNKVNKQILDLELKKIKLIRKLSFLQGTIINFMRVSLLLLMLYLVVQTKITLGEFFSLFIYSFFVFTPLSEFSTMAANYQEAKASIEQLSKILSIPPKKKPKNAISIDHIKEIRFTDVSFAYSSGTDHSVKDISLNIKAGETVAFVGPSGSGKTTLVKLIVGLYEPSKGNILINNFNSKQINYDNLRKKIGLVSQETQLFAGSIRENLLFVNPGATDQQCTGVLRLASITNLLERGNQGLDTKIGEGGIKVSGGERQRLAIARALLRNPDIIIFDEATSSLDSLTEKEITKTIQEISKFKPNLIIIMVAHRLSTISHAKKIYVLQKGKILEQGNHRSLLLKKDLYAALWKEQIQDNSEDKEVLQIIK